MRLDHITLKYLEWLKLKVLVLYVLNAGQRVSGNNNRVQLSIVELIQEEMRTLYFVS